MDTVPIRRDSPLRSVRLIIVSFACAVSTLPAVAEAEIYAHRPFLTGEAFLALSQSEHLAYATGVVEGILSAPYLGAPLERASRLDSCLYGMSGAQIAGILTAYLQAHSEERPYEMPTVTLRALDAACR